MAIDVVETPKGAALKDAVLQAGLELLDQKGPRLALASISYARVFEYLESEYSVRVTRASVHERIWANQDEFRHEVLAESIPYLSYAMTDPGPTVRAMVVDVETFARHASPVHFQQALSSPILSRLMAAKVLVGGLEEPAATAAHDAFNQRARDLAPAVQSIFLALISRLGLTVRAGLPLSEAEAADLLQTLSVILVEGGCFNYRTGSIDISAPVDFCSTPADGEHPWRIASVGFKSLLDFLFEPSVAPAKPDQTPNPPGPAPPLVTPEYEETIGAGRRPRHELKRLVLDAAVELLIRDGLELEPEILGYTSVLEHLKTSRGFVVHRATLHPNIWPNNEAFHLEVLALAVDLRDQDADALAKATGDAGRVPDRQNAGPAAVRDLLNRLTEVGRNSTNLGRVQQVKATFLAGGKIADNPPLRDAVARFDEQKLSELASVLQDTVLDTGYVVKPELGLSEEAALELLRVLAGVTISGSLMNQLVGLDSATKSYTLDEPPEGPRDGWKPAAIAIWAYINQLYRYEPAA